MSESQYIPDPDELEDDAAGEQDELYEHYSITADRGQSPLRLDKFLTIHMERCSRNRIQTAADAGNILVNGKPAKSSYKVKPGDRISLVMPYPKREIEIIPENIPLEIPYEDDDLLIVNKPAGLVVHPGHGNYHGTLVNAIAWHMKDIPDYDANDPHVGLVHRIDKDTSGLLIVAKNDKAHQRLAEQIKEHSFTRVYEAVVHGNIREEEGGVDAPIGRHPVDRKKMAVTEKNSRHAVTHFTVLARYPGFTHLRLQLETGRTHQIRVHMAYLGHPVAGDPVYGPKKPEPGLQGQCLHARIIGFIHPSTGEYMEFDSGLPPYFTAFLEKLRRRS